MTMAPIYDQRLAELLNEGENLVERLRGEGRSKARYVVEDLLWYLRQERDARRGRNGSPDRTSHASDCAISEVGARHGCTCGAEDGSPAP